MKKLRKKHWSNLTGYYKTKIFSEEDLFINLSGVIKNPDPKFWKGQKPQRIHIHVRTHQNLIDALKEISSGQKCWDNYRNTSGINRDRLRTAQRLRDIGRRVNIRYIARAGKEELVSLI